uniref:Uncharacterized protein n=1 Tax=Chaetoceros debilis TaxID=122233 RepID=A0A7S3QD33_9STRA
MASSRKRNPKFKVNPAFANAHGLSEVSENLDPWEKLDRDLVSSESPSVQVGNAIHEARRSGKLIVSNAGLSSVILPDVMFDLRNDLVKQYDGAMDGDNFWDCYGEEMLKVVDISDNDLSPDRDSENKKSPPIPAIPAILDKRIGCYTALQTLRIRNCNLHGLPWDVIQSLTNLSVLDAQGNAFTAVPLWKLPESIVTLKLANNSIECLGNDISMEDINLQNLVHLDASNNKLIRLPSKLEAPKLQHLILAKNHLESLPAGILHSCRKFLVTLDLAGNQLKQSMNLSQHANLQVLELRGNILKEVPVIHSNLSRLGLSFNDISSIEGLFPILDDCDEYGKTKEADYFRSGLRELHLEKNDLGSFLDSKTLAAMTKLSMLDVSNNSLENLPYIVGYLSGLEKIILDGCPMRMIRNSIKYKESGGLDTAKLLTSLRNKCDPPQAPGYYGSTFEEHSSKKVAATPPSVIEARSIVRKATIGDCTLDLSGRGLSGKLIWTELVDALVAVGDSDNEQRGNVVSIWKLSHGKITDIDEDWVNALPSLSIFDACRNNIRNLPKNFTALSLQKIEMQRNCMTSISLRDQLCSNVGSNLDKNLMHLNLSNNQIDWIPGDIFNFPVLAYLDLSHNSIKSLAWEYDDDLEEGRGWRQGLPSLQHLDLSNNSISNLGYLPLALAGCQYLRTLFLNNNCIYEIPLELGLLDQLTSINLLGNSQRRVRVKVLTQSCHKILEYFRDRMTPDELRDAVENHREIREAIQEETGCVEDALQLMRSKSDDNNEMKCEGSVGGKDTLRSKNNGNHQLRSVTNVREEDTNIDLHESKLVQEKQNLNQFDDGEKLVEDLKKEIVTLTDELENLSISQAKRFALKKALAMQRSKLIREERKLKTMHD